MTATTAIASNELMAANSFEIDGGVSIIRWMSSDSFETERLTMAMTLIHFSDWMTDKDVGDVETSRSCIN